jgi:hypothetical protein
MDLVSNITSYNNLTFVGGLTMAKYQITIEVTTQLSREIEANSAEDAEQYAESMYQEYQQGNKTHITGTTRRRSVELTSARDPRRWLPVGE